MKPKKDWKNLHETQQRLKVQNLSIGSEIGEPGVEGYPQQPWKLFAQPQTPTSTGKEEVGRDG